MEDGQGGMVYLERLDLTVLSDEDRGRLALHVVGACKAAPDRDAYRPAKPTAQEDRPAPDPPKATPNPRRELPPDQPRRQYDDDVVRYEVKSKKGEKLELFKWSPGRKALDRDYSRAVCAVCASLKPNDWQIILTCFKN